ncbi:MAG: RHS repeat protein, partial [Acidobacteria bacterium]|nr:RHS repeat protein [Acidobacteriota bacterium]
MNSIKGGMSGPREGPPSAADSVDQPERGANQQNRQPPTPKPCPPCEKGQKAQPPDPVILTGGKNYLPYTDISIPGPGRQNGVNLEFRRCYSNQDGYYAGAMKALGWFSNLDIAITKLPGSSPYTLLFRDQDGSIYRLRETGTNTHIYEDFGMRVVDSSGIYILTKPFGITYTFSLGGSISTIADGGGNYLTYTWSTNAEPKVTSITDSASRSLTFEYTDSKLTKVTDPIGREWHYAYGPMGYLESVTSPLTSNTTRTVTYGYNEITVLGYVRGHSYDSNNIVSITDARGHAECFKYSGLVTNILDGPIDDGDRVISRFRRDGKEIAYSYNNSAGTSSLTEPGKGTWYYQYETKGYTTSVQFTNGLGRAWAKAYAYNANGQMTNYVDSATNSWSYTYGTNWNIATLKDPLSHTLTYTLDTNTSRWATRTDRNGHTVTRTWDAETGTLTAVQDARTNSTYYTCNAGNQTLQSVDRNGHTNSFEYNSYGDLTKITDGMGKERTFTYDTVGRMLTTTEHLDTNTARTTTYTYDDGDRVTKVTLPDSTEWHFAYDENDNLTSVTDPLTHTTAYEYDEMDRLKSITDALSHTTTRSDESDGNTWTITDAEGRVVNIKRDEYDRVIETSVQNGGGTYARTLYEYDGEGNLIKVTDANSHTTKYEYDALSRLSKTTYPDSTYEEYTYDYERNVLSYRNRSGSTVSMEYDGNDRMTGKGCPSCAVAFQYDDEGNLTEVDDTTAGT